MRTYGDMAAGTGASIMRPAHLLMACGYLVDQAVIPGSSLCLSTGGFDPERLRLAALSAPFMHAGLLLGVLIDNAGRGSSGGLARIALQCGAMLAAMMVASKIAPGSAVLGLLVMLAAMALADATCRLWPATIFACISPRIGRGGRHAD